MASLVSFLIVPLIALVLFYDFSTKIAGIFVLVLAGLLVGSKPKKFGWSIAPLLLVSFLLIAGGEDLLKFYPFLANLTVAVVFLSSFFSPPCLVLRLAKKMEPDLPPEGVDYCKKVNLFWVLFLLAGSLVSLWSALFGSPSFWAIYNGLISYILIGLAMLGEYLIRLRVKKNHQPLSG